MISAIQIATIAVLGALVAFAIWWLTISYQYRKTLTKFSYTKGANLDTGSIGQGNTGVGAVAMTCDFDREICLWKATAICSGVSETGSESGFEPISSGGKTPYGNFDPNTTVDLTLSIGSEANGLQNYVYDFDGNKLKFGGQTCPINYNQKTGIGSRPHLVATYSCIPKGSKCESSV